MRSWQSKMIRSSLKIFGKFFGIAMFFFCFGFSAFSEGSAESSSSSEINLDSVCRSLSSHAIMKGDFVQEKTISSLNRTLKSFGTFIFSDEGIVWKTEKPFPSVMAVSLDKVVQTRADGTKTFMDASQNQIFLSISKSLSAMFSGNKNALLENFNVDFKNEKNGTENKNEWKLFLTPKDESVSQILKSIQVSGKMNEQGESQTETQIDEILMTESSQDTIKYIFSNQTFPERLTQYEKNYFAFK